MAYDTSQILNSPQIVNSYDKLGKVSCALAGWGFFMVHFSNFLTFLTLVSINIVIASAGPGKVSCADNGPVGYFCGPFSQLSATVLCSKKLFPGLKICERKSGKN